jgi:3-oxoacyl-[acyl-carrier protein] reductase
MTEGLERIIVNKEQSGMRRSEILDQWIASMPIKRIGRPQDLADIITFLASERAGFITGTTLQVDGGLYKGTM